MTARNSAGSAADTARRADGDALEGLARVGLIAYGIVHLLIAWLSLQLAWSGGGQSADQSGALQTLADSPVGKPLLWVLAVGLVALAAWQLAEVFRQRRGLSGSGEEKKEATVGIVKSVAKTVVYLALAVLCVQNATGGGSSGSGQQQQATSGVFALPGGRFLVGVAGLVVLGVGVYHVVKGVKQSFMKEIDVADASPGQRRLIERLGTVGYIAKGVALGVVGVLLTYAAITYDAAKASGLDGAMRTILDAPFGKLLLTLVALGIAAYGVFCFFRARYPQRT
ncbi:DUF1206 domain-containing protein [Modestobacter sp. I12A-02628]|uniref:DUF1206 domain-containing protein n=1 Tax=Goekera deserti TaxID=2497753 RepID=A0A7K3WK66_9ACTN|nr:DUF1206 domain-containing protein [Goekera deserti]MPQ96418.1 DUF1206 domain-containing protein [Goekera deserti]NDI47270.1 DUF1206 domain-containing protein [Goekera deserti]NEL56100.1 DUF1206 domain-containing protein [Goekera deserti]